MQEKIASTADADIFGPAATIRAFFALVPDDAVRARLAALAGDVARRARGRTVLSEHVHLTMAFLGDVPGSSVTVLRAVGDALPKGGAVLEFDQLGAWRASGVAWIAPSVIPPQLPALHGRLAEALAGAGFVLEKRAFRPHITLARRCVLPPARARCESVFWRVDRLSLIGSVLRHDGPVHRELQAWPLTIEPPPAGAT